MYVTWDCVLHVITNAYHILFVPSRDFDILTLYLVFGWPYKDTYVLQNAEEQLKLETYLDVY